MHQEKSRERGVDIDYTNAPTDLNATLSSVRQGTISESVEQKILTCRHVRNVGTFRVSVLPASAVGVSQKARAP